MQGTYRGKKKKVSFRPHSIHSKYEPLSKIKMCISKTVVMLTLLSMLHDQNKVGLVIKLGLGDVTVCTSISKILLEHADWSCASSSFYEDKKLQHSSSSNC